MQVSVVAQQAVNAVTLGSIYALLAIGYTIVYGILRLVNFAHGDSFMLGAYGVLLLLTGLKMSFWTATAGSLALAGLLGLLIERSAYRPLRGTAEVNLLISSLAVSMILENLVIMVVGARPRTIPVPRLFEASVSMGDVIVSYLAILIVVTTFGLMAALLLLVTRTKIGIAMRATANDLEACVLMGVDSNTVIAVAFATGAVLAGAGGILWASKYTVFDPLVGFLPGLKAFIAAVLGGIGILQGAVLGGYLLGAAEVFLVALLPSDLSAYRDIMVQMVLIVVLLVKPEGLLGRRR